MSDRNKAENSFRKLTTEEEIFNSITHGIGAFLSIAASVFLVALAVLKGNIWHVVSFSVYGSSLVLLYLASTLYHSFTKEKLKNLFARFDHAAIFLLIAGTYTPFLLTSLRGTFGWTLFGIIWGTALAGVVIRSIYLNRFKKFMVALYLVMGWMFVFAAKPMFRSYAGFKYGFSAYRWYFLFRWGNFLYEPKNEIQSWNLAFICAGR